MDHREGIHVHLEVEASSDEVAAVEQALREAGIDAPVEAAYERRGIGTYPWILIRADLPDEAWQQLLMLEILKTKSGQLRWDDKARAWRDTWEIETDPR
jgi:hypothetical protein